MAIEMLDNVSAVYNSVNLSNHVRSISVDMVAEDLDATAMGAVSRSHVPGLRDDTITISYFNDDAAGSVNATHRPLLGVAAGAVLVVKADSGATSATNPAYTMTAILLDYHPISGEVGAMSMNEVVYKAAPGSSIVITTA